MMAGKGRMPIFAQTLDQGHRAFAASTASYGTCLGMPQIVPKKARWFFNNGGEEGTVFYWVWVQDLYMGVSENSGTPKSSIKKLGFSIIFTLHFGCFPLFSETPISYMHIWALVVLTILSDNFVNLSAP